VELATTPASVSVPSQDIEAVRQDFADEEQPLRA
jgi:hypothetical protein